MRFHKAVFCITIIVYNSMLFARLILSFYQLFSDVMGLFFFCFRAQFAVPPKPGWASED